MFHACDSAWRRTMTEPTDVGTDLAVLPSRRRFLREGSALMGGAVLAGSLAGGEALAEAAAAGADNVPPNIPEWMKTPGDPVGSQLYGTPSSFEKNVVRNVPKGAAQYISAA